MTHDDIQLQLWEWLLRLNGPDRGYWIASQEFIDMSRMHRALFDGEPEQRAEGRRMLNNAQAVYGVVLLAREFGQ
jgi:hypothetical protein